MLSRLILLFTVCIAVGTVSRFGLTVKNNVLYTLQKSDSLENTKMTPHFATRQLLDLPSLQGLTKNDTRRNQIMKGLAKICSLEPHELSVVIHNVLLHGEKDPLGQQSKIYCLIRLYFDVPAGAKPVFSAGWQSPVGEKRDDLWPLSWHGKNLVISGTFLGYEGAPYIAQLDFEEHLKKYKRRSFPVRTS